MSPRLLAARLIAAATLLMVLSIPADADLPLQNTTPVDCSGAMTGAAAQPVFSSSGTLHGFFIMNNSADLMCIAFNGAAATGTPNCAQGSYPLPAASTTAAGGSFTTPVNFGPNTALSIIGPTIGDKWSCTRW